MSTPTAPGQHHAHGEVANPNALIITFLALTFGVVFVVLVLVVYHNSYLHELKAVRQEGWTAKARDTYAYRSGSITRLNQYGESNGTYYIPIHVAAEKVVAEYQGRSEMSGADISIDIENDGAYAQASDTPSGTAQDTTEPALDRGASTEPTATDAESSAGDPTVAATTGSADEDDL